MSPMCIGSGARSSRRHPMVGKDGQARQEGKEERGEIWERVRMMPNLQAAMVARPIQPSPFYGKFQDECESSASSKGPKYQSCTWSGHHFIELTKMASTMYSVRPLKNCSFVA